MKIVAQLLNILLACCDVIPDQYSSKPLGALTVLWDIEKGLLILHPQDIKDAEALRQEIQSDIKVMFAKRGIPVK